MEVSLKRPEVQRFLENQVKQGQFASPSEVIELALLRLMLNDSDQELDVETLAAIRRGDEQLDRGEGTELREAAAAFRTKHKDVLSAPNA